MHKISEASPKIVDFMLSNFDDFLSFFRNRPNPYLTRTSAFFCVIMNTMADRALDEILSALLEKLLSSSNKIYELL